MSVRLAAWTSVWSESSLSAWRYLGSLATHSTHSEDSDQTGWRPRLIWVFAQRTLISLVLSCRGSFHALEASDKGVFEKQMLTDKTLSSELAHEIMALFVLSKLILQTCIRSHPVGLHVCFLVGPFVYFDTSCLQRRLWRDCADAHIRAVSSEPLLVAYVISTIISWAVSHLHFKSFEIAGTKIRNRNIQSW